MLRLDPLKVAFKAKQRGVLIGYALTHELLRTVAGWKDAPDPAAFRELKLRYEQLLERDWRNANLGHYPKSLLFESTVPHRATELAAVTREIGAGLFRSRRNGFQELPKGLDLAAYPAYFRRTFHWQSEGYLSARSAKLYDSLVEFLFLGTAAAMRRQAIVPFSEFARSQPGRTLKVLDVGCGTGSFLRQLAKAHPAHAYTGIELSPFYADHARRRVRAMKAISITCGNAESLPFPDNSLDVVASIYLFHELPSAVRRGVLQEMKRVLRPGGLIVVQDSAQLSESPQLEFFLERFHERFHEPFFKHYLRDDLERIFADVGFPEATVAPTFVAKTVWARNL